MELIIRAWTFFNNLGFRSSEFRLVEKHLVQFGRVCNKPSTSKGLSGSTWLVNNKLVR
ncbi:hypothetical protein Hdeb2414_s0003g00090751 [Helianthus debilis subsp. tardiflorus]